MNKKKIKVLLDILDYRIFEKRCAYENSRVSRFRKDLAKYRKDRPKRMDIPCSKNQVGGINISFALDYDTWIYLKQIIDSEDVSMSGAVRKIIRYGNQIYERRFPDEM